MYSLLRAFLFLLPPETAHSITLNSLNLAHSLNLLPRPKHSKPCKLMGLTFPNPVGLAAGLDKNGDYIEALASLGFGFIEIGTVTPRPQAGNPKPRLFRLTQDEALINRLGFNNKGLDYVVERLKKTRYTGILGVNIGKNRDTPNERAVDDYVLGFQKVSPYASYVTINISSPNTKALRDLQHGELLKALLKNLKHEQALQPKYVPLVVKIAPDLSDEELAETAEILVSENIDGVIATNTTLQRENLKSTQFRQEAGGLSGKPVFSNSTLIVQKLRQFVGNKIPIIGCGGIMTEDDALKKLEKGADLIQLYTGLIYKGPDLVSRIVKNISSQPF